MRPLANESHRRPTMSRKQFEIIAKALYASKPTTESVNSYNEWVAADTQWWETVNQMVTALSLTNGCFDGDRFETACETGDMGSHRSRGTPRQLPARDEAQAELDAGVEDEGQVCDHCPACGGPATFQGKLGDLDHYRCRDCGLQNSRPIK